MGIHIYFYIDTIFRPVLSRSSSSINYKSLETVKNYKHIVISCHYNDFDRCASIGFQKLIFTYWPSPWLRPWSICGDEFSWISNASRTFLSSFFKSFVSVQQNPTWQVLAWSTTPFVSHFFICNGLLMLCDSCWNFW